MMMKYFAILMALLAFVGCQTKNTNPVKENQAFSFFVGSYTDGDSEGIYKYLLEDDGTLKKIGLAAKIDNPTFLALSADNQFLVAVDENRPEGNLGHIASFRVLGDSLEFISKKLSGGDHPVFVAINESGYVFSANLYSGSVGLYKLDDQGALSDTLDIQQHTGMGATDRQKSPHAHSVWFEPESNRIITCDLGTDELWFSDLDTVNNKLVPAPQQKLWIAAGAGPRHLVFHPNNKWIYVANELNSSVSLVQKMDDGLYKVLDSASTIPVDFANANSCADVHVSLDGKFVYASNRGHNSIAIFEVNPSDGTLKYLMNESTHGETPRNFAIAPNDDYVVVANQNTNNLVSFKRDKSTGLLTYVNEIEATAPVCIKFQN